MVQDKYMIFSEQQKIKARQRSDLYKGHKGLFTYMIVFLFLSFLTSCFYTYIFYDKFPVPQNILKYYASDIPAGEKMTAYFAESPNIAQHHKKNILNIGAFFYAILLFVILPFFLIWTAMLVVFYKKNAPFIIQRNSYFSRKQIFADNAKLLILGVLFVIAGLHTFFYDYKSLVNQDFGIYMASLVILFFGMSGVLFSITAIALLFTIKSEGEK